MSDSADGDADPYPNQNNRLMISIYKYINIRKHNCRLEKQTVAAMLFCVEREELFFYGK